jgi:hypothetical protein
MPAKITLAGEKAYKYTSEASISSRGETYQTDSPRDGGRERAKNINSRTQPLRQSLIAVTVFLEFSYLLMKDCKYGRS